MAELGERLAAKPRGTATDSVAALATALQLVRSEVQHKGGAGLSSVEASPSQPAGSVIYYPAPAPSSPTGSPNKEQKARIPSHPASRDLL